MQPTTTTRWKTLLRRFSLHELDFEEARKRLLFGVFCVFSTLMMGAFSLFHASHGHWLEAALNALAALVLLTSVFIARGRRDAHGFYHVPAIVVGLLFMYFATLGAPEGYRMLWLYAYPPMVLFLVGARQGLVYVGIVTSVWLVALLVPSQITGPGVYDPALTLRFITSYMLVVGASWFLESVRSYYAASQMEQSDQLERDRRQMHNLAYTDELTELPNRRSAQHKVDDTLAAMSFDDSKSALIAMLDIDHFKIINDHFGHPVGDLVLKSVARRVRNAIRSDDFVGRYGGEEFLFVITGAKPEQYGVILDKVRLAVCQRPIKLENVLHHVTVSLGGTRADVSLTQEALIEQADQALYVAKQSGRNRCVLYRPGLSDAGESVTVAS